MTSDEVEKIIHKLWDWREPGRPNEEAIALLRRLRDERDEVRTILASTDIAALPNDYPLARIAQDRMDTLNARTLEGLALIGKVERLTAEVEKARKVLTRFADASRSYAGGDYAGDDYCDEMQTIKVGDLRTAARVHAELAEKEKV